jgi:hypothetical protein
MAEGAHPELTAVEGGVVLVVHAQPGARRSEVVGRHGEAIKIRVAAPAVEGRANEALIAFVAEQFGLRRSAVSVRSGASSRHKRLRLDGIDVTTAARVVDRLVGSERAPKPAPPSA